MVTMMGRSLNRVIHNDYDNWQRVFSSISGLLSSFSANDAPSLFE
jgi:hypothetical protein